MLSRARGQHPERCGFFQQSGLRVMPKESVLNSLWRVSEREGERENTKKRIHLSTDFLMNWRALLPLVGFNARTHLWFYTATTVHSPVYSKQTNTVFSTRCNSPLRVTKCCVVTCCFANRSRISTPYPRPNLDQYLLSSRCILRNAIKGGDALARLPTSSLIM